MDIRIGHSCPSCAAPLELYESDRVSRCSFCEVQNYMTSESLIRFVLPDKIPDRIEPQNRLFFPYLRFKGNIFTCQGNALESKVLDTTYQGVNAKFAAPSLGLRPQAMQVRLADENLAGRFIKRTEPNKTIFQRAALMAQAFKDRPDSPAHHRAFIGETISCIYLPIYLSEGRIYDGVLNVPLGPVEQWLTKEENLEDFKPKWRLKFMATICPQCGASMEGEPDSLVLHCYNCGSCALEKNGKFVLVPYRLVESDLDGVKYLPFWRIRVEGTGITLRNMADLLTVTNQPVVVTEKHQQRKLEMWIPALNLRPKIFLRMARKATLSQMKFPEGEKRMARPMHPVTLPLSEAVQALKSVLAETTVHRKEVLPKLPGLSFTVVQTSLTFLPFEDTGHDLVQTHSALSVASSILKSGRNL